MLNQYCEHLATIKVTDQQIFDALSIMYHLNDMDSQRALNGFQNRAEQMFACMIQGLFTGGIILMDRIL